MTNTWVLGFGANNKISYNDETLVGTWEKRKVHKWDIYDVCIWREKNNQVLVGSDGHTIIKDYDNWLKEVELSRWPKKREEVMKWVVFKLIKVMIEGGEDPEEDDETHYTDI